MIKMIFLNLPVKDLTAATTFYEAIGCTLNPQFSNEQAACMVWSDTIVFMILVHDFYSTFTGKPIVNAHETSASLICLSCDSKEEVDRLNEKAGTNGGTSDVRPVQDMGFMYSRAFDDPDGNTFELVWMDPAAAEHDPPEQI